MFIQPALHLLSHPSSSSTFSYYLIHVRLHVCICVKVYHVHRVCVCVLGSSKRLQPPELGARELILDPLEEQEGL